MIIKNKKHEKDFVREKKKREKSGDNVKGLVSSHFPMSHREGQSRIEGRQVKSRGRSERKLVYGQVRIVGEKAKLKVKS